MIRSGSAAEPPLVPLYLEMLFSLEFCRGKIFSFTYKQACVPYKHVTMAGWIKVIH